LLLRLLRRAVIAVRVAHMPDLGDERLERRAQLLDAVDGERAEGRAVVGDVAGDRLVLVAKTGSRVLSGDAVPGFDARRFGDAVAHLEVLARELPSRLDGLRSARAEKDPVEVARCERRHLRGELDRARVRVRPVRVEGQLAHLVERRLADLLTE